jgi:hypothetical protein
MKFFEKNNNNNNFYDEHSSLDEIANYYETDKGTSDKHLLSWAEQYPLHHCMHYTKVYHKYMSSYREVKFNMLEVGICDKRFPYASAKMWMTYFKNVNLYCVDNFWGSDLNNKLDEINELTTKSINFIYADQGNYSDWNAIKSLNIKYNFIVEDGSHWPNHMMVSLWQCCDLVESGGYYFMEDIQNPCKSRGWFKYDNSLIAEELLVVEKTKKFYSSFLNDIQNKDIDENFELVEMVLDPLQVNYLAVFRKK